VKVFLGSIAAPWGVFPNEPSAKCLRWWLVLVGVPSLRPGPSQRACRSIAVRPGDPALWRRAPVGTAQRGRPRRTSNACDHAQGGHRRSPDASGRGGEAAERITDPSRVRRTGRPREPRSGRLGGHRLLSTGGQELMTTRPLGGAREAGFWVPSSGSRASRRGRACGIALALWRSHGRTKRSRAAGTGRYRMQAGDEPRAGDPARGRRRRRHAEGLSSAP
jgi:hypothetical protein